VFAVALCLPALALAQTTMEYPDVALSGGFQSGHFPHIWDLTRCDLTLTFTYDGNGLVDDYGGGAHAWGEMGLRAFGYGDFNPTWMTGGAGVWLATDYHWGADTFDPDPPEWPVLDLDDKLLLQRGGGMDESYYDLPGPPPNHWANHRFWFDRDGVDQWQAQNPLAVDGGTYNTGGLYEVAMYLFGTGPTSGNAYITVNGLAQGFETDGDWSTMELSPAGMTFTGDMTAQQVFYGLYGYGPEGVIHSVAFTDITVTGCLGNIYIDGCDTGVTDQLLGEEGTMSDAIAACAEGARNHGAFVRCVAHLTSDWMKAGLITEEEKEAIMECAAEADIP
jgi:hypothetical protein